MKTLKFLDKTGDTVIEFDETEAKAGAKREAQALFERMRKGGMVVSTKRPGGQPDQVIRNFDQIEDGAETIVVPPIVAG